MIMEQEKVEFYKVRSTSEIISATIAVFKEGIKPLLLSLLFIIIPYALLEIVIQDAFVVDAQNSGSPVDTFTKVLAMILLMTVMLTLVTVVSYSYLKIYRKKENVSEITVGDIWSEVAEHGLQFLLGMFLYFIFIVIGFVLLFLPGIWISIALSLMFPVIIFEGKNAFDSIGRSHHLIKNYWWNTCGLLFLAVLIYYLVSLVFMVPSFVFGAMMGLNGMQEDIVSSPLIPIFAAIASFAYLFYPIIYIASAFQYFNLVEIKEAKGLQDKVDLIGQQSK